MTVAIEAPVGNVSARLARQAREAPERAAVVTAAGRVTTYAELEGRCNAIARALLGLGLAKGDRVSLFVRPGPELIAVTHACFRTGLVPVLIDPGMGRRALLACIAGVRPRALVGVARAHLAKLLFPSAFASVEHSVCVGPSWGLPARSLAKLERAASDAPVAIDAGGDDQAAILFTSGSTGPPKGVRYTHAMFVAQQDALRALYRFAPGDVDVACFPLFALFDNALGVTTVFPPIDPSRPGACDPAAVWRSLEGSRATLTFGSPAIWRRVVPWMEAHGRRFTTLDRVTIAGAPVPPPLVARLRALLPAGGDVHTPYGATEALPVTSVSGTELADGLAERTAGGEGTCVGRPAPGIELRLIAITDAPLATWDETRAPAPGEPGEVCVRGAVVTREYADAPAATAAAKIADGDTVWHRMGDVGRLDAEGRLWFLGRKAHRVQTEHGLLMPVPVENVFNRCEGVRRTALVGVGPAGRERPWLVVEPEGAAREPELLERLRAIAPAAPARVDGFLFHPSFPVDVRHNAKIRREDLKVWAAGRIS